MYLIEKHCLCLVDKAATCFVWLWQALFEWLLVWQPYWKYQYPDSRSLSETFGNKASLVPFNWSIRFRITCLPCGFLQACLTVTGGISDVRVAIYAYVGLGLVIWCWERVTGRCGGKDWLVWEGRLSWGKCYCWGTELERAIVEDSEVKKELSKGEEVTWFRRLAGNSDGGHTTIAGLVESFVRTTKFGSLIGSWLLRVIGK